MVPQLGIAIAFINKQYVEMQQWYMKALEAKAIKLIRPYNKRDPAMNNIATATIVDPWGVSIELTESLNKIH